MGSIVGYITPEGRVPGMDGLVESPMESNYPGKSPGVRENILAREILGMGRSSRRYVEHVKPRRLSGRVEIQGEREGQSEKKESRFGRRIVVKTILLSSLLGPD